MTKKRYTEARHVRCRRRYKGEPRKKKVEKKETLGGTEGERLRGKLEDRRDLSPGNCLMSWKNQVVAVSEGEKASEARASPLTGRQVVKPATRSRD